MNRRSRIFLLAVVLLAAFAISGCKLEIRQLWQKAQPAEPALLNVEMHFNNGDVVYGYVKSMGIADDEGEVYNGGSSLNYIYDQQGKITGSFNYAHLAYMKLLP